MNQNSSWRIINECASQPLATIVIVFPVYQSLRLVIFLLCLSFRDVEEMMANPTALWTGQQIIEAFPEVALPRFLLRDRDSVYGEEFRRRVAGMGIEEVITTARSPWQNPYGEPLIGSIRRECLDHLIVFNERPLRRILRAYFAYYNEVRPHQSLARNAQWLEKSSRQQRARSFLCRKLADCIIAICAQLKSGWISVELGGCRRKAE